MAVTKIIFCVLIVKFVFLQSTCVTENHNVHWEKMNKIAVSKQTCDIIPRKRFKQILSNLNNIIFLVALSNGKHVLFDFDGRPRINLEGYLTKKYKNDWNVMCEDNLTAKQQELEANHACRYLGFR